VGQQAADLRRQDPQDRRREPPHWPLTP
jgi:hypothetical protein